MMKKYLVILGVATLFFGASLWLYKTNYLSLLLSFTRFSLPSELQGATFISDQGAQTIAYPFLRRAEAVPGKLISATNYESGSASIIKRDATFSVMLDGNTVLEDTRPRLNITRSSTGSRIAYAEAEDPSVFVSPADAPLLANDRSQWKVVVYEPLTRTSFVLGNGVAPFFVDDTHVAWMAPAGLAIADLTTGTSKVLVPDIQGRTPTSSLVSPDHSIIGWYSDDAQAIELYRVSVDTAEPVSVIPLSPKVISVTLSNDALYSISLQSSQSVVMKQSFTDASPHTIMKLPLGLYVKRLLLGSI
ncbi:MAG: hypothetical protein AAB519_00280 [Patescibacteria group bacterium]